MNYLPNRKKSNTARRVLAFIATLVLVLFIATFFFSALSGFAIRMTKPLLATAEYLPGISRTLDWLLTKRHLIRENERLSRELEHFKEESLIKDVLLNENSTLKNVLGRTDLDDEYTVVAIIARPNRSPYDTFVVDGGLNIGLSVGDTVFDEELTAVGTVEEVYGTSAKVKSYSAYKTTTDVLFGDEQIAVALEGRGGGNFMLEVPKDVVVALGDVAVLPGRMPRVVAYVGDITEGTDTSLKRALLVSPINTARISQLFVLKKR